MDAIKITALEAENVKRVKAVQLKPSPSGLTVIGGRNNQGKTSVLDAIAWALGGDRNRPEHPKREGSANDPKLRVELSNGIVVERKGAKSALHVTDPSGHKAGQKLLDSFIDQLALNLPRFMDQSDKDKADTLLKIIGVGDKLAVLDDELARLENRRLEMGRIAKQKRGAAEELPFYAEAPATEISATELIQRQQAILAHNAENKVKRDRRDQIIRDLAAAKTRRDELKQQVETLQEQFRLASDAVNNLMQDKLDADSVVSALDDDLPTDEIEADLREIDTINERIRANARRNAAMADAEELKAEYEGLDAEVNKTRDARRALLEGAHMPLPGLSVEGGALTYQGQTWDGMSGSDRLKVAAAIVRELKPQCGFVLVDKLEQMDVQTLEEFGRWAESEQLQIIGTRVATDDTCTIVIEDGYARSVDAPAQPPVFKLPGSEDAK